MTQKRGLRGALWFSFLCLNFASFNWLISIALWLPSSIGQGQSFRIVSEKFITVLIVLAISVGLVLAQQLFFLVWGLITHALIRINGPSRHTIGHTLSATQYCAGTFIICAVPICGFYFSLISLVWMAVAMVSALAALHKISRWRTAFAVLVPLVAIVSVSVWFVYAMVVGALGFLNGLNPRTPMNFPPMPQNSPAIVAPTVPDASSNAPPPTQDPAPTNAPKNTSSDSAAILNITHGI